MAGDFTRSLRFYIGNEAFMPLRKGLGNRGIVRISLDRIASWVWNWTTSRTVSGGAVISVSEWSMVEGKVAALGLEVMSLSRQVGAAMLLNIARIHRVTGELYFMSK